MMSLQPRTLLFLIHIIIFILPVAYSFAPLPLLSGCGLQSVEIHGRGASLTKLRMADELGRLGRLAKDKLSKAKDFIEETGNAKGGVNFRGAGAGAVAGGLVLGPFGAAIGFMMGKNAGAGKAAQKAAAERLGLTPEVMLMIADLDSEVVATKADFENVKDARDGLGRRLRKLQRDAEEYYTRAKSALAAGNEEGARTALTLRQEALDAIPSVERDLDDAEFRVKTFARAMSAMEERLQEILAMQRRCASASATASEIAAVQEPLIQQFRNWED